MTKSSYRLFDICLLTIIACVIEGVLTYVSNMKTFMLEGFSISFVIIFALIGIFRWNIPGVFIGFGPAITAIIVQNNSIAEGVNISGYTLGMIIGSMLGIASLIILMLYFKYVTKKEIKKSPLHLFLYIIFGYILYILVYSFAWSIIDRTNYMDCLFNLIRWNLINIVMAIIILFIANKQRDFFVDMNDYLVELHNVPESIRTRKEINEDDNKSLIKEIYDSDETNDISLLEGGTLSEDQLIELNKKYKEKEGGK